MPLRIPNECLLEVLSFVTKPELGENVSMSNHRMSLWAETLRQPEYSLVFMWIASNEHISIIRDFGNRRIAQVLPLPISACPLPPSALTWIPRVLISNHGFLMTVLRFLHAIKYLFRESALCLDNGDALMKYQNDMQRELIFDIFDPYVLTLHGPSIENLKCLVNWLYRPRRASGSPRLLILKLWPREDLMPALIAEVKKRFLDHLDLIGPLAPDQEAGGSQTSVSKSKESEPFFSVWFVRGNGGLDPSWEMEQFSLCNDFTGEKLTLACNGAYLLTRFSKGDEELVAESALCERMRPHLESSDRNAPVGCGDITKVSLKYR